MAVSALVLAACGSSADDADDAASTDTSAAEAEAAPETVDEAPATAESTTTSTTETPDTDPPAETDTDTETAAGEPPTPGGAADPSDETDDAPSADAIVVVDDRGVEVVIESTERIIPVDGDLAEVVFALGAGDRVVATDISATFPAAADALPEIGYQRALAAEPILQFEPTLVLATDIAGPTETLDDLERLGVPVVLIANDPEPEGPARKIRQVANALGMPDVGEALAAQVQGEIDDAAATAAELDTAPRVAPMYMRGAGTQLILGEASGIHWLIGSAGGVSIADELGIAEAEPINTEALVAAAPDVIILPDAGLASVGGIDGFLEIPGMAETPAAQNGRILTYDDQYLLGNGPRTGELLAELIDDLHELT